MIAIEVQPYPVPPVVEVDGVAFVRVDSTTRRANAADLGRLNERRPLNALPFDSRPLPGASVHDLDRNRLQVMWSAARDTDADPVTFPGFEAWLVQHQLARLVDGRAQPNATAVLVYGLSPQDFLPAATIDLVRYRGVDVDSDVATRKICSGSLPDQLDTAWAWMASQIEGIPAMPDGVRQAFVPTYPEEALKELVRNLVQHRLYEGTNAPGRVEWYDDRVEFSNPGGPYGAASQGEFGAHSDYRNPLLTARLVELGYVQRLGGGVRRARQQLESNGNPPLRVYTDGFTRVVVERRP